MNWTTKGVAALATGITLFCGMGTVTAVALTGHHGTAPAAAAAPARTATPPLAVTPPAPKAKAAPAPASSTHNGPTYNGPVTIINQAPQPGSTVYVPVPAYAPAYFTTNQDVVQQYYSYINAKDFSSAWNMGGSTLSGGSGYQAWVNGYSTTSWVTLGTWDYYPGYNAVGVTITATQTDGSVRTYSGSYTVYNGSITSASIVQTSGGSAAAPAAPAGLRYVGDGVYANSDTSDAFALAVKKAYVDGGYWYQSGTSQFYVYSSGTSQSYLMTSSSVGNPVVVTGGNGALVQFNFNS